MRTLYLCRHAKSSWADPGQDDFDRPLNDRGQNDAPMMARRFKERNEPVDLIVSSDANRALTTAHAFARELRIADDHFNLEPKLYHANVIAITEIVNALPDIAQHAILVGHNPGFTQVVEHFSSEDIGNLPTCGMVRIDFTVNEWREVLRDLGTLVWFDYPKREG